MGHAVQHFEAAEGDGVRDLPQAVRRGRLVLGTGHGQDGHPDPAQPVADVEAGQRAAHRRVAVVVGVPQRLQQGDGGARPALQEALAEPEDEPGPSEPARPNWAAIVRAAEKTAQSGAEHQEEEPVDEQAEQSTGVRPAVFPS